MIFGEIEGMCCGAHSDDGFACFKVIIDMFHLFGWKLAEAGSDDHKIGFSKGFEAWDVIINGGGDKAGFWVNREKNGAVKTMMLGEDFA